MVRRRPHGPVLGFGLIRTKLPLNRSGPSDLPRKSVLFEGWDFWQIHRGTTGMSGIGVQSHIDGWDASRVTPRSWGPGWVFQNELSPVGLVGVVVNRFGSVVSQCTGTVLARGPRAAKGFGGAGGKEMNRT